MGLPAYTVQQSAEIILHTSQRARFGLLWQQQTNRRATLPSKDQSPTFHAFDPALLLIAGSLQSAVYRHDLRDRKSFRLEYPLSPGPFFGGIQFRDPDTQSPVCTSQPLQRRVGKQMRSYRRAYLAIQSAPPQNPANQESSGSGQNQQDRFQHYRSQPRRRNQM
jgi:hypothetical protein